MIKKLTISCVLGLTALLSACGADEDTSPSLSESDQLLKDAFENRTSDLQVQGQGTVTRLLSDDEEGDRHQRFVLELASDQTLLVAHNIDLAARIDILQVNDIVEFYGEYEWNSEGGVIHWTHDDLSTSPNLRQT